MSRHTIWSKQKIGKLIQLARKPVKVCVDQTYREIGIRSHGKGIFYKDEVLGLDLGSKRVFWVEPGCFVVNIVFAWEQAVAKTTDAEKGMIASHRFPMYRPLTDKIDLDYLLYFFKTPHGKYLLELASPGGAGRNKTLGQEAFLELAIPVPPIEEQRRIAEILSTWDEAIRLTQELIDAKQQRKKGLMQRLLTGQVRFKEFGERPDYRHALNKKVPLDWQILEFGNFVEKINTKFDPQNENMELPCVELEHIAQESGQLLGYTTTTHQRSVKNRFHSGDILFGKLRPYLKKYARPDFDGVCSSEIWVISGKKGLCRNDFLFYLIQSDRFIMAANVTSGTKMPRADWEYVSEFAFAIPPAEEQGRIASVLQACDHEIQLLQQKLAALQQQKKGLMQRLLTGQVRVQSVQPVALVPVTPSSVLTSTQAFIIWLIAQYQPRKHAHPSRTEAQKLAYFAQEAAGLPLNLHFYGHEYGPFSKELYQHLADMEGALITGFQGGEPQERKEIAATTEAIVMAEDYLRQYPAEQEKLAFVLKLVQGFETPRQMELLATVHWIMKSNPNMPFVEIVRHVHEWNKHKQSFRKDQIRQAWEHLRQFELAT